MANIDMNHVELPPRQNRQHRDSVVSRNKSSLEILTQMGFSNERSQKAVAATGNKGVQLASDWLLSHVNDPALDLDCPRDYTLYLCPVGDLQDRLLNFYRESMAHCGWNRAHQYFPHITLCSFFRVSDQDVSKLEQASKHVTEQMVALPSVLPLQPFSAASYLGLFVKGEYAEKLKSITNQFAAEVKELTGAVIEPHKKQLHITLAYGYQPDQHEALEALAKSIDLNVITRWDLRLYSRDPRVVDKEVRKVVYPYSPQALDEHELIQGDFMIVDPNKIQDCKDGWPLGLSWLSGTEGHFPLNYTEKTAESETWTMHRSIPLCGADSSVAPSQETGNNSQTPIYAKVDKKNKTSKSTYQARQLFIMRHGERVDFTFGRDWVNTCVDDSGNYMRLNLNMPKKLPRRQGGHQFFHKDSPLTELGLHEAYLTGEAMREKGVQIDAVYSSPSLRCVQTASQIMRGLGQSGKQMKVETGLFEWLGWYQSGLPTWMSKQELRQFNLNVDPHYKCLFPINKFSRDEDTEQYYNRCHQVTSAILRQHQNGDVILLVAHAASLDTHTRQLIGKPARPYMPFMEMLRQVPYCSLASCQEDPVSPDNWHLVEPPVPNFRNHENVIFDWSSALK